MSPSNGPWVQPSSTLAGTTSRWESSRNGSPPVPSPRSRANTEPRPGNGSRTSGSRPNERSSAAIRFAASSSGPAGFGGLIDGIRISSARKPTRCSWAACQSASGSAFDGRESRPAGDTSGAGDDRADDAEEEAQGDDGGDHQREQEHVRAFPLQLLGEVRILAPG